MELNQAILARVLEWGQGLEGFKPAHAAHALTIVQGYVEGVEDLGGRRIEGVGDGDEEKLGLFAMAVAWTFWIDELFDAEKAPSAPLVDIEAVIRAMDGAASTPESAGFHQLTQRLHAYRSDSGGWRLWLDTAADAVRAWRVEERLSSGHTSLSYAEYTDNGFNSTAVPYIIATASLLYQLEMPRRLEEEPIRRLLRHLSISCRLHNDVFSVDKERQEGSRANAVLLLERFLPPEQARALVLDDLRGYERMLAGDVARLSAGDPFARLARVMPEAHRVLYTAPGGVYRLSS